MRKLYRIVVSLVLASSLSQPSGSARCLSQLNSAQEVSRISLETRVQRGLAGGESHLYRIALNSGQYFCALVKPAGTPLCVTIYAPDGRAAVIFTCYEDQTTPVSTMAAASGDYRLEVRSRYKEAPAGNYDLTVSDLRTATALDKQVAAARNIFAEGNQLREEGKADSSRKAIKKYEEALSLWQIADDKREQAYTLVNLGETYYPLGEQKKALQCYNQALLLNQQLKDIRLEGQTLGDIGNVHLYLGETKKALEYCSRALKLSQENNNRREQGQALNNIGEVYYKFGDKQKALEYHEQALGVWRSLGDRSHIAQTLLLSGYIISDMGDARRAIDTYDQALLISRADNDQRTQTTILVATGQALSRSGKKQDAIKAYDQAMRLVQLLGDPIEEARILNGIAFVYEELGEDDVTLDYYSKSSRIYQSIGYKSGQTGLLLAIGQIYNRKGEYKKALDHFQKALSMAELLKYRSLESYALKNIGAVYDSLGDEDKALEYYNRAVTLYRELKDQRGEAYPLNAIGNIYAGKGDKEKAIEYLNQALELNRAKEDRFVEVTTLFNLARVKRDLGRLAEARALIEDAIGKIESLRSDLASYDLRSTYLATVRKSYELSIDILMQQHKQDPSAGLSALALNVSEQSRARSLLDMLAESRADIRHGVDSSLLERERALQQSLNEKAEQYSRLLNGKHAQEQADSLSKEVEVIATSLRQVQAQIRVSSPRYAALTQPQPASLNEIQQKLIDSDTLLLEYALGDDRSYLWAVTPGSIKTFELASRAEIEKNARLVYQLLTAQNQDVTGETVRQKDARIEKAEKDYLKAAAELSRMILGPATSELRNKRLLIVADGALQYIPFAALPVDSEGQGKLEPASRNSLRPGPRPLIVDHEVINLPSASTLRVLRDEIAGREPAPKAVAVIADPVFSLDDRRLSGQGARAQTDMIARGATRDFERAVRAVGLKRNRAGLSRLLFSHREASAIVAAAPEGQSMKATDFDASLTTVMSKQLRQYRIIHFATHGLLNSEHPELSGIVLSLFDRQGQKQNGFLRLYDVYNLNLPAELVVLSACQTGLGKEIKGEGLVGLTRGFMYAGAARVMASLWKVDDAATAKLMERFYTKLFGSNLRPAAALREAQIEMWKQKQTQSPYSWAGFVLQGEWR